MIWCRRPVEELVRTGTHHPSSPSENLAYYIVLIILIYLLILKLVDVEHMSITLRLGLAQLFNLEVTSILL